MNMIFRSDGSVEEVDEGYEGYIEGEYVLAIEYAEWYRVTMQAQPKVALFKPLYSEQVPAVIRAKALLMGLSI